MGNAKKNVSMETGRRGVLKAAAALVAAPILMGGLSGMGMAAESGSVTSHASGRASGRKSPLDLPLLTKKRVLGSGKFSMEVSALGFGVMGANYNRGVSPDKKTVIEVIRQAAEHGVTLFDTAQVYGPLTNEELAGEALAPYKNTVAITTKFGHRIVNGVYQTGRKYSPGRGRITEKIAGRCHRTFLSASF